MGPAFEGEAIRKGDMYVEFGGPKNTGYELVEMVGENEIEDGKIEVIGPEIDDVAEGSSLPPVGIVVKIFGRKMQKDFEGFLNGVSTTLLTTVKACGIWLSGTLSGCESVKMLRPRASSSIISVSCLSPSIKMSSRLSLTACR